MTEKNPGVYPRSVSARLDAGEYMLRVWQLPMFHCGALDIKTEYLVLIIIFLEQTWFCNCDFTNNGFEQKIINYNKFYYTNLALPYLFNCEHVFF